MNRFPFAYIAVRGKGRIFIIGVIKIDKKAPLVIFSRGKNGGRKKKFDISKCVKEIFNFGKITKIPNSIRAQFHIRTFDFRSTTLKYIPLP